MSAQVLATPSSPQNGTSPKKGRPTASFDPCVWGNHFLSHSSKFMTIDDATTQQEYEQLKEEVRRMLNDTNSEHLKKLYLIDAVQRLGVDYHFEREIDDALEKIYHDGVDCSNLYNVALWFRVFRQQGINVPSDVFETFMNENGKFKADLVNDVPGMLSLYEAAHLALPDEDILDEAIAFTTSSLESISTQVSTQLAEQISRALNRPIRKNLLRLEARHHISLYSKDDHFDSNNGQLLRFAKLDFNLLQAFNRKELSSITEWWKKLDFTTKLPFARDRLVECYFWAMDVYFEPKYSVARTFVTKVFILTSVMDDIYDNYGTYDELQLLTKCIERWDVIVINQLPEYMKLFYQALLDIYSEMEEEVAKERRSYVVQHAKESFKRVAKAYFVESKWREEGYAPSFEEYMKNAQISSGYPMLVTNSYVGMGNVASKEAFEWISNDPKMLMASAILSRLMNDIVSHQLERDRDHVFSAVESYIKEHGVSREETVKILRKEITDSWKVINEGCMKPTAFPMPLLTRILNFTRAADVMYKDDDAYTKSYLLKDTIASLLVDPVVV
ncbi:hypothetical protein SLEP1_g574 [Rubroshorea leprosula]|uniref:(+)-delta-cadinene synthase n=1 Tax=Rubroshorea leprosula TaxID=152421 RepID=A0AAV5HGL4_9ROSI|nr:hypothetical protein SLEP1_g574 [Rubroshorea leprosula]